MDIWKIFIGAVMIAAVSYLVCDFIERHSIGGPCRNWRKEMRMAKRRRSRAMRLKEEAERIWKGVKQSLLSLKRKKGEVKGGAP